MTKRDALSKAAEYEAEAQRALPACILTGDFSQYDRANAEAKTYRWLATLHQATRRAWIIRNWSTKQEAQKCAKD